MLPGSSWGSGSPQTWGGAIWDDRAARGCPCGREPHPCQEHPAGPAVGRTPARRQTDGRLAPAPSPGLRAEVGSGSGQGLRRRPGLGVCSLRTPSAPRSADVQGGLSPGPLPAAAAFPCSTRAAWDRLSLNRHSSLVVTRRRFPGLQFADPTLPPGALWATGSVPGRQGGRPQRSEVGDLGLGSAQDRPLQWPPLTTRGLRARGFLGAGSGGAGLGAELAFLPRSPRPAAGGRLRSPALPEARVAGGAPSLCGRQHGEQGCAGVSPGRRLLPCACLPPDLSSTGLSAAVAPRGSGTAAPPMGSTALGASVSQDTALLPSPLPARHTSLLPPQQQKTRCAPLSRPCRGPGGGGPAALQPPPPRHLRDT